MKILFPRFFRKPQLNHTLSSFLVIVILIIVADSSALGQADKCSKPKVAFHFTELWDEAVEFLNSKSILPGYLSKFQAIPIGFLEHSMDPSRKAILKRYGGVLNPPFFSRLH